MQREALRSLTSATSGDSSSSDDILLCTSRGRRFVCSAAERPQLAAREDWFLHTERLK